MTRDGLILAGAGLGLAMLAFVVSAVLCSLVRRWAPRLGLIDRPSGHKGHLVPTPLGGGIAIWAATVAIFGVGIVIAWAGSDRLPTAIARHLDGAWERVAELGTIVLLATVVAVVGLIDDRVNLSWRLRLAIQLGMAALLAASGIRITLFWPFTHPILGGVATALWVAGLTNAFNMLDNMDGLAAGVGIIAALLFAGAQVAVGSLFAPAVLLVLVGSLAGFLLHNRAPARLFMGDAGSNFLGFFLGAMTVAGTYFRYESGISRYSVLAPLLVMAVPLYDSATVVAIRLREGRSPFRGDRCHFSHRLVDRGLTPRQAVRTIDLVTLASGLGALLLHRLGTVGACVVVAQTLCLLGVVAVLDVSSLHDRYPPERPHGEATPAAPDIDRPVGPPAVDR